MNMMELLNDIMKKKDYGQLTDLLSDRSRWKQEKACQKPNEQHPHAKLNLNESQSMRYVAMTPSSQEMDLAYLAASRACRGSSVQDMARNVARGVLEQPVGMLLLTKPPAFNGFFAASRSVRLFLSDLIL